MSICWYTASAFRSLPRNHSSSNTSNKFFILMGMTSYSVPALAHQVDLRNISLIWVDLSEQHKQSWKSASQALPCMAFDSVLTVSKHKLFLLLPSVFRSCQQGLWFSALSLWPISVSLPPAFPQKLPNRASFHNASWSVAWHLIYLFSSGIFCPTSPLLLLILSLFFMQLLLWILCVYR